MTTGKRLLSLLDDGDRRKLGLLLVLSVVAALLETFGIASVIPFLAVVANPEAALQNPWVQLAFTTLGFDSINSFLVFLGVAVFVLLVLTNAVTALTMWGLLRFAWMAGHRMSVRILKDYIFRPYEFFLDRNSAELGSNLLSEVWEVVRGVILPAIKLIATGVKALFIVALLVIVDPLLAGASVIVLGGLYGAVYVIVRRRVAALGRVRFDANRARFQAANEVFGGIKDVKVLGREPSYVMRFARASRTYANSQAAKQVIVMLPTQALEIIVFGGILLFVLYRLAFNGGLGEALPIIGLYAVASYRLKPSLTQAFDSLTALKYAGVALDRLSGDLRPRDQVVDPDRQSLAPLALMGALDLRGISYHYPGTDVAVFDGFDLSIKANTSIAFVGTTGSGKTTLADIIMGLLRPQRGELFVDGVPLDDTRLGAWQNSVGYVPQQIFLSDISVAWNIAFGVPEADIDMAAVERAAKLASIHDFIVNELPNGYDTVVGERGVRLSGGQRQRIGIARALYNDPEILILDEATSALDGVTEDDIFSAVSGMKHAKTVVMIAHRIGTVRECDTIYLLEHGQITAEGTYDELLRSNETFRKMALGRGHSDMAHDLALGRTPS
ncbi:ABC transporter ATP-binding protein [Natronospira sp.]|uniref:ABC transporter ATP-binding protein n=1 Tax=Natronospira sp. TaxID=2024970 RepID=UPI003872BC17